MRFEEPVNGLVARFPEFRVYAPRETVPYVTHEEIAEGIARGRRLHARFCRQTAYAVIVKPARAAALFAKRLVVATLTKLEKDRAFRSTFKALSRLEDSQLNDIGISRSDILYVARTLAYADDQDATVTVSTVEPSLTEDTFTHARAA